MVDTAEWPVIWARISFDLSNELSREAGTAIGVAFSLGFSDKPSELLRSLNSRGFFTGASRRANLQTLCSVLEAYKFVPSVSELRSYVLVRFLNF
jgi:hypothetical protein